MAASAWAEQQMRDLNLKARRAARDKVLQHHCSTFPALMSYATTVLSEFWSHLISSSITKRW